MLQAYEGVNAFGLLLLITRLLQFTMWQLMSPDYRKG